MTNEASEGKVWTWAEEPNQPSPRTSFVVRQRGDIRFGCESAGDAQTACMLLNECEQDANDLADMVRMLLEEFDYSMHGGSYREARAALDRHAALQEQASEGGC